MCKIINNYGSYTDVGYHVTGPIKSRFKNFTKEFDTLKTPYRCGRDHKHATFAKICRLDISLIKRGFWLIIVWS